MMVDITYYSVCDYFANSHIVHKNNGLSILESI